MYTFDTFEELLCPHHMSSNFSEFSTMLFSMVQVTILVTILVRSSCSRVILSLFYIDRLILVSSAKEEATECSSFYLMSPIITSNSKGPNTEPWSTPLVALPASEFSFHWHSLHSSCQETMQPSSKLPCDAVSKRMLWSTSSKAFAKSKWSIATLCPFWILCKTASLCFRSWGRHDRPCLNPCCPTFKSLFF